MSVARIKDIPYPEDLEGVPEIKEYLKRLHEALQEEQSERIEDFDVLKLDNMGWEDVRGYAKNTLRKDGLAHAISKIGSTETTLLISNQQDVTADATIPLTMTLQFTHGGSLNISDTKTVTINGHVEAGSYQIFEGLGTVAGLGIVKVAWFGVVGDGVTDDTLSFVKASEPEGIITVDENMEIMLYKATLGETAISIKGIIGSSMAGSVFKLDGDIRFKPLDDFVLTNLTIYSNYQVISAGTFGYTFANFDSRVDNVVIENIIYENTGVVTNGSSRGNTFFRVNGSNLNVDNVEIDGCKLGFIIDGKEGSLSDDIQFNNIRFYNVQTGIWINGDNTDTLDEDNFTSNVHLSNIKLENTTAQKGNYSTKNGSDLCLINGAKDITIDNITCIKACERTLYATRIFNIVVSNINIHGTEGLKFVGKVDDSEEINYISHGVSCDNVLHTDVDGGDAGFRTIILYDVKNVVVSNLNVVGVIVSGNITTVVLLQRYLNNITIENVTSLNTYRGCIYLHQEEVEGVYTSSFKDIKLINIKAINPVSKSNYYAIRHHIIVGGTSIIVDGLLIENCSLIGRTKGTTSTDFDSLYDADSRLLGITSVDRVSNLTLRNNYVYGTPNSSGYPLVIGSNCDNIIIQDKFIVKNDANDLLNADDLRAGAGSNIEVTSIKTGNDISTEHMQISMIGSVTASLLKNNSSIKYQKKSTIVDDTQPELPFVLGSIAKGSAYCGAGEWIEFMVQNNTVTKLDGSANFLVTNTDGKMCIFLSGGFDVLYIRNRLGSTQEVVIEYTMATPLT